MSFSSTLTLHNFFFVWQTSRHCRAFIIVSAKSPHIVSSTSRGVFVGPVKYKQHRPMYPAATALSRRRGKRFSLQHSANKKTFPTPNLFKSLTYLFSMEDN